MRPIVRPLLEAKQCDILRMPVACIAPAGHGEPFSGELQKLMLGREFDKLGQEERVRVLRGPEERSRGSHV